MFTPFRASVGKFCSQRCHGTHRTRPAPERFWDKVHKTQNCWIWTEHLNATGYGRIEVAVNGRYLKILAHRFSYELHVGKIPEGMCVLHKCDNPRCVRPEHLYIGTNADNVADRVAKGHTVCPKGLDHPGAKLTEDDVREIRALLARGARVAHVAKQFKMSEFAIWSIKNGKTWKHVD